LRSDRYPVNDENHAVYDQLFTEYLRLHDLFGRGGLDTMKTLRTIKAQALRAAQPIS
jgi:L-ribulokinase